jgi:hypothetical protein
MTVRLKPRDRNENWLLIKKPDEYARAGAMAEVIEREGARQAKMASKPVTTKANILTGGPSGNSEIPYPADAPAPDEGWVTADRAPTMLLCHCLARSEQDVLSLRHTWHSVPFI